MNIDFDEQVAIKSDCLSNHVCSGYFNINTVIASYGICDEGLSSVLEDDLLSYIHFVVSSRQL